jgi:hypothetical protein
MAVDVGGLRVSATAGSDLVHWSHLVSCTDGGLHGFTWPVVPKGPWRQCPGIYWSRYVTDKTLREAIHPGAQLITYVGGGKFELIWGKAQQGPSGALSIGAAA